MTSGSRGTAGRPATPRVVIADDDQDLRARIRGALQDAGFVVIAEAGSGRDAIDLAVHFRPDVLLMDVVMVGLDGIGATRVISERVPEVRVVLITSSDDEELGVLGLRAGADGHVTKDVGAEGMVDVVRRAAAGEPVLSAAVARRLIERLRQLPDGGLGLRPVRSPLTPREWEVLDLMCAGLSVDEITDGLVLSRETVRTHVKRILRKLGVHSQAEAVEVANDIRGSYAADRRGDGAGRRVP